MTQNKLSYYKMDILDALERYYSPEEAETVLFEYMQIIDAMEEDVPPKQFADKIHNHKQNKGSKRKWLNHINELDNQTSIKVINRHRRLGKIAKPYYIIQNDNEEQGAESSSGLIKINPEELLRKPIRVARPPFTQNKTRAVYEESKEPLTASYKRHSFNSRGIDKKNRKHDG
ncbi:hypothetical protein [Halobacillus litoralis]|uniref:hypothetical protein n=1 Tax=Halobacillus litoralis TaxID=45668 RepID=UPI001CD3C0C0|nr:hypothetical protein [Halobacillus litoralis]MCA1023607.1 hypothetical protein [Halobacillus litoralis]